MWARQTCSCRPCAERETATKWDAQIKIKKTLTCPVAVVCQSRKVQSRDIIARLCATKSLQDLHGRRLAEKRARDKHQLQQSGGSALLKLSNTLPASALVYLQAGRRQGAALQDKPLPADWLSALLKPHPCCLQGRCGQFYVLFYPFTPPFLSEQLCVP